MGENGGSVALVLLGKFFRVMKGRVFIKILSCLAFLVAAPSASAQETLTKDPLVPGGHTFSWFGEPGWTYFLQHSDNATSWSYFPDVIEVGTSAIIQKSFILPGPRQFIRFRATDYPTDDAYNADFDSDGVSNIIELGAGTDPIDFFNGVMPVLTIVGGQAQQGEAGSLLLNDLIVRVAHPDGTPWNNAPVRFDHLDGGLQSLDEAIVNATEITVRADADGHAAIGFVIPSDSSVGSGSLVARAASDEATFEFQVIELNVEPTLVISYPAEGQRYSFDDDVDATVVPTDPDGSVVRLKLFLNGELDADIDTSVSQNFGPVSLTEIVSGWNTLVAEAFDDDGASSIAATHFFVEALVSEQVALGVIGGGILRPIGVGEEVSIAAPVALPAVFAGSVESVAGNVITVNGAPGWNPSRFADGLHAVTVLEGEFAGAVWHIDASGENTLTVDFGVDLADLVSGDRLRIVPVWTVQSLAKSGESVELEIDAATPGTHVLVEDAQGIGVDKPPLAEYFVDANGWHEVGAPEVEIEAVILDISAVISLQNPANAPAKIFAPIGDVYDFPIVSNLVADAGVSSETPLGVIASAPISLNQSGLLGGGINNAARRPSDTITVSDPTGHRVFYIDAGHWREFGAGAADVGDEEMLLPGATIVVHQNAGAPFTSWLQWPRIR